MSFYFEKYNTVNELIKAIFQEDYPNKKVLKKIINKLYKPDIPNNYDREASRQFSHVACFMGDGRMLTYSEPDHVPAMVFEEASLIIHYKVCDMYDILKNRWSDNLDANAIPIISKNDFQRAMNKLMTSFNQCPEPLTNSASKMALIKLRDELFPVDKLSQELRELEARVEHIKNQMRGLQHGK